MLGLPCLTRQEVPLVARRWDSKSYWISDF